MDKRLPFKHIFMFIRFVSDLCLRKYYIHITYTNLFIIQQEKSICKGMLFEFSITFALYTLLGK